MVTYSFQTQLEYLHPSLWQIDAQASDVFTDLNSILPVSFPDRCSDAAKVANDLLWINYAKEIAHSVGQSFRGKCVLEGEYLG
jgi:hypothetical protein